MSIFDSINICEPQPKMISLQEESPEIHSDTKTKHPLSKKNKHFSLSKTDSQKSEQADLKLILNSQNLKFLFFLSVSFFW